MMPQQVLLGVLALSFLAVAACLFAFRNQPEKLNQRLPIIRDQRVRRLHPLFRKSSDVWSLAFLFFAVGGLLVFLLVVL